MVLGVSRPIKAGIERNVGTRSYELNARVLIFPEKSAGPEAIDEIPLPKVFPRKARCFGTNARAAPVRESGVLWGVHLREG